MLRASCLRVITLYPSLLYIPTYEFKRSNLNETKQTAHCEGTNYKRSVVYFVQQIQESRQSAISDRRPLLCYVYISGIKTGPKQWQKRDIYTTYHSANTVLKRNFSYKLRRILLFFGHPNDCPFVIRPGVRNTYVL